MCLRDLVLCWKWIVLTNSKQGNFETHDLRRPEGLVSVSASIQDAMRKRRVEFRFPRVYGRVGLATGLRSAPKRVL